MLDFYLDSKETQQHAGKLLLTDAFEDIQLFRVLPNRSNLDSTNEKIILLVTSIWTCVSQMKRVLNLRRSILTNCINSDSK